MNNLYSILKFLIGWPFSILAVFFIIKLIAPQAPALLSSVQKADPGLLFYGITCFVIFYFLRSYIWHRLINQLGHKISFKNSSYLWGASELKRYIPGNVWSFLGRTVLFSERGVPKKDIASSLIIEAELFVLGGTIVSILSLPFLFPGFSLKISSMNGFAVFSLLAIAIFIYTSILTFLTRHSGRVQNLSKTHRSTLAILDPARMTMRVLHFLLPPYKPSENFFLILLSVLSLFFFGLGNYFVIGSIFSLHPQLILELTGFFVLSFLAGYLSILTPAGFGVREGIMFYGLAKILPSAAAAFASVFSRIVLILSELIFITLAYTWHKWKMENGKWKILNNWLFTHPHEIIIGFLAAIYSIYFSITSFLRYDNFYTGRFDLGNMAQTVWNTTQGNIFLFTNPNGSETVSRLAFHADFILALLAPFYAIWPSPKVLLLIQAVVVSIGAFFVYLIAKHIVKNKNLSLVFAFAYLINPGVQRANLYDFHAVVLATTFLLGTYYCYIKRRYLLLVVFAFLAALCKEQIWAIIAIFGVFLFVRQKQRLLGTGLFLASVFMFYYLIWQAIPQAFGSQHFALSYFSDFGDGPSGIIKSIIFSPDKIINLVLEHDRIEYLRQIFSPLGYLSFLAPVMLIFAGPDLIINLLSNNAQLHQIYYQYTATVTPFIFIAGIWGAGIIKKYHEYQGYHKYHGANRFYKLVVHVILVIPVVPLLSAYLLLSSLSAAYHFGPLPGSKNPNLDMITKPLANREFIDQYLSNLPKEYKIAASNNAASHLSERENIYVVPLGIDKADMAIFLLTDQWSLKNDTAMVEKLKQDPNWQLTLNQHPFYVFSKKIK